MVCKTGRILELNDDLFYKQNPAKETLCDRTGALQVVSSACLPHFPPQTRATVQLPARREKVIPESSLVLLTAAVLNAGRFWVEWVNARRSSFLLNTWATSTLLK